MKLLEQTQTEPATKHNSLTWLFLAGWCCHLLSIVTLMVLSGIATDIATESSLYDQPLPSVVLSTD